MWNLANKSLLLTINGHKDGVYSLDFSPNSEYLVSGGWDNSVKLWNIKPEWSDWIAVACERIQSHPRLNPEAKDFDRKVDETCTKRD